MERWRLMSDYGGRFEVSDRGRVRRARDGYVMSQQLDKRGYSQCTLWDGAKSHWTKVHQLVMRAFGPPRPSEGHDVDHINLRKADNRVENLRWLTKSDNVRHQAPRCASGVKGVVFRPEKKVKKWQAYAYTDRFVHIGLFHTKPEAVAARMRFAERIGLCF